MGGIYKYATEMNSGVNKFHKYWFSRSKVDSGGAHTDSMQIAQAYFTLFIKIRTVSYKLEARVKHIFSACYTLNCCLAYSAALKTEVTYSSETSTDIHHTMHRCALFITTSVRISNTVSSKRR
jgi:hypothetical protein